MKRKIWLTVMICSGIIMTGCGKEEASIKEMAESEIIEQGNNQNEIVQIGNMEFEKKEENIGENIEEQIENDRMEETIDGSEQKKDEEKVYLTEDYGEIEEYGGEFYFDEDNKGFYYHIESFYLNSDFLYTMNDTLEEIYDEYLEQYLETQDWYMEQGKQELPEGNVPYSKLVFQGVQYVDNDYISLLFNDVTYMGGATAYSRLDAITLDRHTGKEVSASEILGESDDELLHWVNKLMGLDEEADWEDLDFYLQDEKIVFFYRVPGFWEEVILRR